MDTSHKTTGRKRQQDRPKRFEISIPESVFNLMELHLLDPISGKPTYGSRSKLIQMLLREYFEGLKTGGVGDLDVKLALNLAQEGLQPSHQMLLNTVRDCLIKGGFASSATLLINLLEESRA